MCFEGNFFRCHACGAATLNEHAKIMLDDVTLCNVCFDRHATSCSRCEGSVFESITYLLHSYCNQCMRTVVEEGDMLDNGCECDDCQDSAGQLIEAAVSCNFNGIIERQWECAECERMCVGSIMPRGVSNIDLVNWIYDSNERPLNLQLCIGCFSNREEKSKYKVNNYTYKPVPDFRKVDRDLSERSLYFGTEVEIEVDDDSDMDTALKLIAEKDSDGLFYCKSDSCINHGFELVSHPFTFGWMKENDEAFSAMFSLGRIMKGWESINCGMHVHMSMDAFSNLQLLKFMKFFYANKSFITALARRPEGKLEQWAHMNSPDSAVLQKFTRRKRGSIGVGRAALSVENGDTIECRIFRSTLAPIAYYGNVEFLQALFDYTKTCGLQQLHEDRFMSFVHDRAKGYPNFIALTSTLRATLIDEE